MLLVTVMLLVLAWKKIGNKPIIGFIVRQSKAMLRHNLMLPNVLPQVRVWKKIKQMRLVGISNPHREVVFSRKWLSAFYMKMEKLFHKILVKLPNGINLPQNKVI